MRTYFLIGLAVGIVVVLGWWGWNNRPIAGTEAYTGTLAELSARGGEWRCTFEDEADGDTGSVSGTVYVSGAAIRGDFESQHPVSGRSESHMIGKDGFVYAWSPAIQGGIKVKVADAGSVVSAAPYRFSCAPASPAASLFELPADISFWEAGAEMAS